MGMYPFVAFCISQLIRWQCEIRPSHASAKFLTGAPELPKSVKKEKWQKGLMVKGRNEPVAIARVAHVIAQVKGISVEEVSEA